MHNNDLKNLIHELYPGRAFLKAKEAAAVMGVNIKTIIAAIERKYNPLPARNISNGDKNKLYVIPITELCRWSKGQQ
jgi:hypothetical protein